MGYAYQDDLKYIGIKRENSCQFSEDAEGFKQLFLFSQKRAVSDIKVIIGEDEFNRYATDNKTDDEKYLLKLAELYLIGKYIIKQDRTYSYGGNESESMNGASVTVEKSNKVANDFYIQSMGLLRDLGYEPLTIRTDRQLDYGGGNIRGMRFIK